MPRRKKAKELSGLGSRLRQARKRKETTIGQVAEALGRHANTVYHWEAGKAQIGYDDLIRLAGLYEVSLAWLIGDEGTIYPGDPLARRIRELPEKYQAMVEKVVEDMVEGLEEPSESN